MSKTKKKILIVYDYFSPSYRAGGPTQSVVNMVTQLHARFDFDILCSAYEFNPPEKLNGIPVNEWSIWRGIARVFYWDTRLFDCSRPRKLMLSSDADVVYLIGVFSLYFNILPLLFLKNRKIVLSARGMLMPDALRQKSLKKKLFLMAFRFMKWHRKVVFQATDLKEANDIYDVFGKGIQVRVAGNYPNILDWQGYKSKQPGQLEMISVSLVNPMKNHLQVLDALRAVNGEVTYRIYGPVHDKAYAEAVQQEIATLPPNIKASYEGELVPEKVPEKLKQAHLFVLPSKSENFGHSIFEALVAGRPVITSTGTPWKKLESFGVGVTVQLSDNSTAIAQALQYYIDMDENRYKQECENARRFALQKVDLVALEQQYLTLFDL